MTRRPMTSRLHVAIGTKLCLLALLLLPAGMCATASCASPKGEATDTNAARQTVGGSCPDAGPIDYEAEIVIRNVSVVEDPLRAQWSGQLAPPNDQDGAWSFGRLLTDLARIPDGSGQAHDHCLAQGAGQCLGSYTPTAAPDYVRGWLENWDQKEDINCDPVQARPAIDAIIATWPTLPSGDLDLSRAPFRLQAIVRRPDLVNMAPAGTSPDDCSTFLRTPRGAGQLRFVFDLVDASGAAQDFMVILEYNVPADTLQAADVELARWHSLASYTFGSDAYKSRLATLTREITRDGGRYSWPYDAGSAPCSDEGRAHDNNLVALRTQDRMLASPPQFREFLVALESKKGVQPFYLEDSPQFQYRQTARLGEFIASKCASIEAENFNVGQEFPHWDGGGDGGAVCDNPVFNHTQFQAGQLPNEQTPAELWDPGNDDASTACGDASIPNSELRHLFARNTCNGCHGIEFQMQAHDGLPAQPFHIQPRDAGEASAVSRFLQGSYDYLDPLGIARTIDERSIRIRSYQAGLCNPN
jgi:hypothetical protein